MHKNILSHLNEAILLFNRQLQLVYINAAAEILLADSEKHLLGRSAETIFHTPNSALLLDLRQCRDMEQPLVDREITLLQLHQEKKVVASITPLFAGENLDKILVEIQSVDKQLQINKEEQFLAQQNTSRLLVRGLAHEVKNPLGGISGAAQLLEQELDNKELIEYTQIIIQESDRLKLLMDKMLEHNQPAKKSPMSIHEVLEQVRRLVSIQAKDIIIKTDYDPSIPHFTADKNQLVQVVLNIVQNAVQAIASCGVIVLKSRVLRQLTIGNKHYKLSTRIDICDNGCGIAPDMIEQIFYPMITSRAQGSGLGLSIAQSLVTQHNGFIKCQSEPGNTTFSIFLPLDCASKK